MAKGVSPHQPNSPLKWLQSEYCLVTLAGEIWVLEKAQLATGLTSSHPSELQLYKLGPARLLMMRSLEAQPIQSDPKRVIGEFLASPSTEVFDRIAFSPTQTPPKTLNLWVGSPVVPKLGDWLVIRRFLLEVICAGEMCTYRYLVMFLAHMLQKPEEKPGIMIVMLAGQGVGKGAFFRLLSAIWPHTTLLVSDIGHVLGQFNAQIERSFALCLDEALFVGDRRSGDRLKSMVTEPFVTIEQKFQPRRTVGSVHRLFAASNHAHFAQVDADDRRFLFLRVSEEQKGNLAFWTQYHSAIADPAVIAAAVHDLETLDIKAFNPRSRPRSVAHIDQKLRSLNGFERYWHEVLHVRTTEPGQSGLPGQVWDQPIFVSTHSIIAAWQSYERGVRNQYQPRQERELHEALKRLCHSAKRRRKTTRQGQQRGYDLPALTVARGEFATFLGGEVTWDD